MDAYRNDEIHPVLEQVAQHWHQWLAHARAYKFEVFGKFAREFMRFYHGAKKFTELLGNETIPSPDERDYSFIAHVNKAFEFATIFGPSLYYSNPVRTVKPRAPVQIPGQFFPDQQNFAMLAMAEQQRVAIDGVRSILLEAYLNWTPSRYDLSWESRQSVDEALLKGRGLLWTELTESPDRAFRAVVSRFGSVDDLIIDPDARSVASAKWVARRNTQPAWQVERDYGLPPGSVKGNMESMAVQARQSDSDDSLYERSKGRSNDLVVFYQIWSKMGIGGRISGANKNLVGPLNSIFGDYCYLVVAHGCRFPLNLPPDLVNAEGEMDAAQSAAEWPIPFWMNGQWPFEELDFHQVFNSPWPMAHLLSARGELKLLNWVMTFLACHVKNATRDFVVTKKSLGEEAKAALLDGKDLTLIELEEAHGAITECIAFLQHPEVNGDIWKYLDAVSSMFDKRVGLSELLYGEPGATQPRSAAEVNIRNQSVGIRPDDMADQVEGWQAKVAAKEAFCARYLLMGQDVQVCMGPLGAATWAKYVFTEDASVAFHQLEYRIEAGSTRKPNKEYEVRQMTEAMTVLSPIFMQMAQATGDVAPLNNLISDFCKSRDLDPNRYQLSSAPPPPMLPSSSSANPTSQGATQVSPASGQPQLG